MKKTMQDMKKELSMQVKIEKKNQRHMNDLLRPLGQL
jgi:hypothetical protein